MNDKTAIRNAGLRIGEANEKKEAFHAHLDLIKTPPGVPGTVQIDGETIVVKCFDCIDVKATPRPVKNADDEFLIEYNFQIDFQGERISIWRVYLTWDGHLRLQPSAESARLCDFNSPYVQANMLTAISTALLESPVFAPSDSVAKVL
jgi:hypothetical protein